MKHAIQGVLMVCGAAALVGCGSDAALDRTLATVEVLRGGARLDEVLGARIRRSAPGQTVSLEQGALARVELDSGPRLLLDSAARAQITGAQTVSLEAGRVYAEAVPGQELFLVAGERVLRVSDAAVSVSWEGALVVYVVRGEVSWTLGEARGIAQAGEQITLGDEAAETEPVALWRDWTGGLAWAGPSESGTGQGFGTLEARVPGEAGRARWPLVIRRLNVQVRVVGDLAITEVEQVFFNPASEVVEGLYRVQVPEEAVLQRFAVDRNRRLVDGYIREKAQARQAYEQQVYRGSQLDPALLEWVAPGRYQARIYPIRPGETRRIVVRYAEWLSPVGEGGARLYRYPMGGGRDAPRIQELSIAVDVEDAEVESLRAGMGAAVEAGRVRLRRSDFSPRSDFWLELVDPAQAQRAWRAPHEPPPRAPDARAVVGEADERDYFYLPLRLPERLFEPAQTDGFDLVVVVDVSAGTDRARLELGRSMTEALTVHLRDGDRVAVLTSDLTIRALSEDGEPLGGADPARVDRLLDGLARTSAGGATDLGAAIAAAAALLDPARSGAVVYVGDGAPTVGELEADGLLQRLARLPDPLRLYAVAIGSDANLELLEMLTRGGGLALRVEERSAAAEAALRILGHVTRPVAQRVTVDLGPGIENVYPRRPVDVVAGEVLSVSGRLREQAPATVRVRGTIAGVLFDEEIAIQTTVTAQSTDLRLRWAGERLRQLLLDGAGREEVAELGVRYGLITPFSSFYVPSAAELGSMGSAALRWMDQPNLLRELDQERRRSGGGGADTVAALALGPLALAGCSLGEAPDEIGNRGADREEGGGAATEGAFVEPESAEGLVGAPADLLSAEGPATDTAAPAPPPVDGVASNAQAAPAAAPPPPALVVAEADVSAASTSDARLSRSVPASALPGSDPADGFDSLQGFGRGGGGLGSAAAERRDEPEEVLDPRPRAPRRRASRTSSGAATGSRGGSNIVLAARVAARARVERVRLRHARRRCSDAASLPISDRQDLWRERLGARPGPQGWRAVYREAIRRCEAASWRARRALLALILSRAGDVDSMIAVYRSFTSGSARGYLRGAILRRVRSPQDLRSARSAFGLGQEPDWALVEQVLERARTDAAKLIALRRLSLQYADSLDLKLRLLEMLEVQDHRPEARRLAARLRADARSDAGVRTAVGEMFLRMGQEEEARRVFSEIVEFAPLDELARRRLGDLYRAHGWFEDAYRQYQTLASIRPDDPTALLLLAQAAAGSGRVDEALGLEQRLMETAQPGAERGIARVAQLWTSVRLAKLRLAAREADDSERLETLSRRTRRSGVLSAAGDLRVTLIWSHPDAQLGLYAGLPDATLLARPSEIAPEYGIEAFDLHEQEDGTYRFEVRRADARSPTEMHAELVLVWHEGRDDEVVRVRSLVFSEGRERYRWSLRGSELSPID